MAAELISAVTGWNDFTKDKLLKVAERIMNLERAFNIRHGISLQVEAPSILYSSVPVDGPAQGRDIKPHWKHMLDVYYQQMGWDRKTGRPWPETLRKLGLEDVLKDIWPPSHQIPAKDI